jgi:hypothetical protein
MDYVKKNASQGISHFGTHIPTESECQEMGIAPVAPFSPEGHDRARPIKAMPSRSALDPNGESSWIWDTGAGSPGL